MRIRSPLPILVALPLLALRLTAQELPSAPTVPENVPDPKQSCDAFSLQTLPELSVKQKACIYSSQLVTGNAIFGALFSGAMAEWQHKPPEWPQGFKGLGEQTGTRYLQSMVKSSGTFVIGALLHEDPRALPPDDPRCKDHHHYQSTTLWPRFGKSVLRVVWTHNNAACHDMPAFSKLAGSLSSGFVQLAYLPPSQNNVDTALRGSATAFGGYVVDSVFNEFQADIFGLIGKIIPLGKPKCPAAGCPTPQSPTTSTSPRTGAKPAGSQP